MKERHNISIDENIWEKAQDRYENISGKIEQLLSQDLDTKPDDVHKSINILAHTHLTHKQKEIVKELIKRQIGNISTNRIAKIVDDQGIYSERRFIKKAVEKIDKDMNAPYKLKGSELESQEIQCECGSTFYVSSLGGSDGKCPGCGRQLVDLSTSDKGFQVIESGDE